MKEMNPQEIVREIEAAMGCVLPQDYVLFQISTPLDEPWRKYFEFDDPHFGKRRIGINAMYRLPPRSPFIRSEALLLIESYFGRTRGAGLLPQQFLPIASCWDDETVLLRVSPDRHYGTVHLKTYYILRETGVDNEWDDIVPLASSFQAFLDMLEAPRLGDEQ